MKKNILIFIITIILIMPLTTKAASNDSYIDWTLDRSVFAHQFRDNEDHITNLAWITANNEVAYCIEPGIMADKASYYSSTTNINDTNLKGVDTNKLSLIGYYGYGYKNHNTKEYYMATQELIWRFMGVQNVWWTDQKEGGNTYNLEPYKNEILSLVNSYEKAPIFNFKDKYIVGDKISLNDNNNVLEEYEVVGDNAVINGNNISLSIKEKDNTFKLRRKQNGYSPMYFYKAGYQTIGSFKFAYNYEKSYTIKGVYGKIEVQKKDSDTKNLDSISKYANLKDANYSLYDNNKNLITSLNTNENGVIVFDKLSIGTYYIQENSPSKGYTVSNKVHKITLNSSNINQSVDSYEEIIKNKIIIKKYLDDEEECTLEEGIWFSVYDLDGNLITKDVTDSSGMITFNLNYGKYILRQESAPYNVDKISDIIIEVKDENVIQNLILTNHKIKKVTYNTLSSKKIKYLPNTGKNNLLYALFLMPISILGLIYDKKHI